MVLEVQEYHLANYLMVLLKIELTLVGVFFYNYYHLPAMKEINESCLKPNLAWSGVASYSISPNFN